MAIDNIYTQGLKAGWRINDASQYQQDRTIEADVLIIGSGAGGGLSAEILAEAGLKVVLVEAGNLQTSDDFKQLDELQAYANLYQDGGNRTSSDGAVSVLQGRTVGGTTTVNWTTSLRTPEPTLNHWAEHYKVSASNPKNMQPWFERMEKRFNMVPWGTPPNRNNDILANGCQAMGWPYAAMNRNVKGCWNLGYCGFGCPTNAKQSTLVSTIPTALRNGAQLIYRLQVKQFEYQNGRIAGLLAQPVADDKRSLLPIKIRLVANRYVLAGGALNNPALLLNSNAPDPHQQLGLRTNIHPTIVMLASMNKPVEPYYGAPQSIYSDHFLFPAGRADGQVGYKLEAAPLHPALSSTVLGGHGSTLQQRMRDMPNTQASIALIRDGFSPDCPGGITTVDDFGAPSLNYDYSPALADGFKRAMLTMAELQFAAGAKAVYPSHLNGQRYDNWQTAKSALSALPYEKFKLSVFTAHLMGGCTIGADPGTSVVNNSGQHHQLDNLYIFDGSLFPTSIGANPQLSIYSLVGQLASKLADELRGATAVA